MKNIAQIITLALLVFLGNHFSVAQEQSRRGESYEKGRVEATANIKKEIFVIKAWGLSESTFFPWPTRGDIELSILKEKYKVSYEWVGGCIIDPETSDYADGYNEVSIAGIEAQFGKGILAKVRKEAEAEYQEKYGEMERERLKKFKEALKSPPKSIEN